MINLIPPSSSNAMKASHLNARLGRWLFAAIVATAVLVMIFAFGWLYLDHQTKSLSKTLTATNQDLHEQDLSGVQQKAQTINKNIKIINQVLGSEVRFSDLIQEIGSVLPDGTSLTGLDINKADGALDLTAGAVSYEKATQVAINLGDPKNNLFDKVDIININCPTKPAGGHACIATFKASFSKATKNRFLNAATGEKK